MCSSSLLCRQGRLLDLHAHKPQIYLCTTACLLLLPASVLDEASVQMDSEILSTQVHISAPLDLKSFKRQAQSYVHCKSDKNIKFRFPQVHLLTCLGYSDPHNVEKATPAAMLEVGEMLSIDEHKLWQEFTGYKSLVKTLPRENT